MVSNLRQFPHNTTCIKSLYSRSEMYGFVLGGHLYQLNSSHLCAYIYIYIERERERERERALQKHAAPANPCSSSVSLGKTISKATKGENFKT